jgi:hypothetical protein
MKIRVGGTPTASLETRELRHQHSDVVHELREHRGRCLRCEQATRKRTGSFCAEGARLRQAEADLKTKVKESADLDAVPVPGQEALFGEEECR